MKPTNRYAESVISYIWTRGNGVDIRFEGVRYSCQEIREDWTLGEAIYRQLVSDGRLQEKR